MKIHEYIVVGSGCTGAMAAQTLVEAGKQVLMLDVGHRDETYAGTIPEKDFLTIRKTEAAQYQYLIGKDMEGVAWGKVGKGEQITPPRKHMLRQTDELLPVQSDTFSPVESLGYGGLGIGWGIGCWEWSTKELQAAGLKPSRVRSAYNTVADRIGISATKDEAANYTIGTLKNYQKSPDMDRNHQRLYQQYLRHKQALQDQGFIMGRAPLALLTEDKDGRHKYSYKDMDFYSDQEQSAYRPWITINRLLEEPGFTYIGGQLVVRFEEKPDHVVVHCINARNRKKSAFRCKQLVLAPGILGTARIVLRSFKQSGVRLPLLCNPYSYIPCIQLSSLGQEAERHKLGFAQLSFFLDESKENFGAAMASLYSYQSLMLFRMARQVPFNLADARLLLRYLVSGVIIMGIHQPDSPTDHKYVELAEDASSPTGDCLRITYQLSNDEQAARLRREKKYIAAMRKMGVYALKRIDPGHGSSIHYAGVLPFSNEEKPFTLSPDGRLHGTSRVFVADGSGFTYLPAKGLTFTLMANAHVAAQGALNHAQS